MDKGRARKHTPKPRAPKAEPVNPGVSSDSIEWGSYVKPEPPKFSTTPAKTGIVVSKAFPNGLPEVITDWDHGRVSEFLILLGEQRAVCTKCGKETPRLTPYIRVADRHTGVLLTYCPEHLPSSMATESNLFSTTTARWRAENSVAMADIAAMTEQKRVAMETMAAIRAQSESNEKGWWRRVFGG